MIGATTTTIPNSAIAFPRSRGSKTSSMIAWDSGCITPPVAPWMTRQTTRNGRENDSPHMSEAAVKPVTESSSSRRRPNWFASHPVIGRMIALAARYIVSAHVDSSMLADRLPAMCGSETFTTVVSSTTMNVPNTTEIAMRQG